MSSYGDNNRQVLALPGTAALPGHSFLNGTKNGMYLAGTNSVGFATNGTAGLVISSTQTITTGTWQATAIGVAYGGTGLSTFTAANNAIYSTSSSALTAGTLPVLAGGTGATTKTAGFDALSPMTTAGDLILGGASGTGTRLAIGANAYVLTSNGTTATWAATSSGGTAIGLVRAISTNVILP